MRSEPTTHRYDRDFERDAVVSRERTSGGAIFRALLAVGGVAALAVGSFLDWINGVSGDKLSIEAFWKTSPGVTDAFVTSAAIAMLAVAVLGVLGLATRGGGLLRLAGALGLAGALLLFVQMSRADLAIDEATGLGLWLCVVGPALLLIAGFVPTTKVVTERQRMVDDTTDRV